MTLVTIKIIGSTTSFTFAILDMGLSFEYFSINDLDCGFFSLIIPPGAIELTRTSIHNNPLIEKYLDLSE